MNTRHLARFLVVSSFALALPLSAFALPPTDGVGPVHMHAGHGPGGPDNFGRLLRGLDLTDAQRDQVFNIRHGQAPALRDKAKVVRAAHRDLRTMALSQQFDEAKAKALADTAATAMADIAIMRARTTHQIYKLLTPEQQSQVKEKLDRMKSHASGGA